MSFHKTFNSALASAWIVLKFVIPIYLLADILYYSQALKAIAFLFEPFTALLGLPPEAALSLISGVFLNLYAAVAFAAPLHMDPQQWSVLALFLGVCHSLIVENVIMKQLGISLLYAYALRLFAGLSLGVVAAHLPKEWFHPFMGTRTFTPKAYHGWIDVLSNSFSGALLLSLKIIALITVLIFVMEWIKSLPVFIRHAHRLSMGFTLTVGVILGITYGAGMLIREYRSGLLNGEQIFFVGTFLMICHAIIEDTLLFAIFGADPVTVILLRCLAAVLVAGAFTAGYRLWYRPKRQ